MTDVEQPTERTPLLPEEAPVAGVAEHEDHVLEDVEDHYRVVPNPTVYSYFLHMPPIEFLRLRTNKNWVTVFAVFLVFLNFAMQISLLTIIGEYVLEEHEQQVHSILQQGDPPWYQLHSWMRKEHSDDKCRKSKSLCYPLPDGRITCSPPSIALLSNWELLDTDGDGIWSRQEAEDPDYRALTRCEYNMDSLLIYEQMVLNLQEHGTLEGRLVPMIQEGSGVPKAYYEWYIGEPLMCVYGDADMCGNLFHMGVFDHVLEGNASHLAKTRDQASSHEAFLSEPRGIKDFPSAFDYCLDLLKNRCEQILPYSYRGWMTLSVEKCGKKSFEATDYKSPGGGTTQTIMKVDFDLRLSYENTKTWAFVCFLTMLIIVFFCTMLEEWKMIYRVSLFIMQYERLEHKLLQTTGCKETPRGFAESSRLHWSALVVVTFLRFLLWLYLLYTGTVFLTSGTDYLGLIFDALSLVFIIQIDEALYSALLRAQMKDDHDEAPAFTIKRYRLPVSVFVAEFALVMSIVIGAGVVVYFYRVDTLRPLQEALNCICLVEGERCEEAVTFNSDYWANYWGEVLPRAALEIDRLLGGQLGDIPNLAAAPTPSVDLRDVPRLVRPSSATSWIP